MHIQLASKVSSDVIRGLTVEVSSCFLSLLFGSSRHSVEGLTTTFLDVGAALIPVGESISEEIPRRISFTMVRTHLVSTRNRSVSCTQLATKAGFDVMRDFTIELSWFLVFCYCLALHRTASKGSENTVLEVLR